MKGTDSNWHTALTSKRIVMGHMMKRGGGGIPGRSGMWHAIYGTSNNTPVDNVVEFACGSHNKSTSVQTISNPEDNILTSSQTHRWAILALCPPLPRTGTIPVKYRTQSWEQESTFSSVQWSYTVRGEINRRFHVKDISSPRNVRYLSDGENTAEYNALMGRTNRVANAGQL